MSSASSKQNNSKNEKEKVDQFDIQLLHDSFEKCCENVDALDMSQYLIGFKELYRFFMLLGSVFGFVASDVISKVNILEDYRESQNSAQYETLQSMIEYETSNGITADTSRPSGSRTLLRLHRSLKFIMFFMRDLSTANKDAKSSTIAQKCYTDTLSVHHPWLIRKGAMLAMYTLPAKQQFIERVAGGPCDEDTVEMYDKLLSDIAEICNKVYAETHRLYETNNLLELP